VRGFQEDETTLKEVPLTNLNINVSGGATEEQFQTAEYIAQRKESSDEETVTQKYKRLVREEW
jgi:hypothetical protein